MHGDPLDYFLTWGTYGTWLPGDERGWVEYRHGWRPPDSMRELEAGASMTEDACKLTPEQRRCVEAQIAETCEHRGWILHAVNCRSNHVHVVVSANVADPKKNPQRFESMVDQGTQKKLRCLPDEMVGRTREHSLPQ